MIRYAILCGSAPLDFRQKRLEHMYDFLTSGEGGSYEPGTVIVFPNGVNELLLEGALNSVLDEAEEKDSADENTAEEYMGEVLLYFCAQSEADLCAELSDSACAGVEVVRLGSDEVRKDVIAYYAGLAEQLGVKLRVVYETDDALMSEEELGYERVG
ncbi:MAG: hypothetical protein IJ558_09360 [Treponema sp.]|nr:hypothetical protein [Treponema sp.]